MKRIKIKKLYFHLKWIFKKRYSYHMSHDFASKDNQYTVFIKWDRKYNKLHVIK